MALDIKICGLSTGPAVDVALAGGASHVGFIFFAKSPRNIAPADAAAIAHRARGRAAIVAVSVDAGDDFLDEMVAHLKPDMLQLHGAETPARVAELKRRFCLPAMKAVAVSDAADLARVKPYRGVADRFLLDAKPPAGAELPGGNGVAFDWSLLAALDRDLDYMLSGGLNTANLREALETARPPGIDVSSGVEKAPGVKDVRLIAEFLAEARRLEKTAV